MRLCHLVYHSRSTLPGADDPPIAALGTLLEQCLRDNLQQQITGVLAFHDGCFLQVLEGPAAAVDRLYAAIRRDRRHDRIELVLHEPVDCRRFPRWSMALAYRHPRLPAVFEHLTRCPPRDDVVAAVDTLADIVA